MLNAVSSIALGALALSISLPSLGSGAASPCVAAEEQLPSDAALHGSLLCQQYTELHDRSTDRFYSKRAANPLSACVTLYADGEGLEKGSYYDPSNGIFEEMSRSDGEAGVRYRKRDAVLASEVFALQNPYHFYQIDIESDEQGVEHALVSVNRQWIGLLQRNEFVFKASCEPI